MNQESARYLFQPTFGNRPEKYIGRDGGIATRRFICIER